MGNRWRLLRIAAGLGLLVYVVSRSDWHILGSLLTTPWLIVLVVGFPILGASVEAARLGALYEAQGIRLPFPLLFQVVTIAAFFNFCIPGATGGDVVKMWYLSAVARRHPADLAAIWFVDRLSGLFSLLVLVVIMGLLNLRFVAAHPVLLWLLGSAALIVAGIVLLTALACTRLADPLRRWLDRYMPAQQVFGRIARTLAAFRNHPAALAKAVVVSFVGHVALLATFVELGRFFMPEMELRLVALLALFGLFANAVPLTPGGIGVGEAAFDALFRLAGATSGAGLLLAWRIGMMPLCLLGWILYVAGIRHQAVPTRQEECASGA